jgi:hypothetical protein
MNHNLRGTAVRLGIVLTVCALCLAVTMIVFAQARFAGDALGLPAATVPLDAYVLSASTEGAEVLARAGSDPIVARRSVGL